MFWILIVSTMTLAGWLTYDMFKQTDDYKPPEDNEWNDEWDDNKNHTEGDFH
jgi:hypothetical protein